MSKNEAQKDILLFNYLAGKREFSKKWVTKKTSNANLQDILNKSSKKDNGERGEPDFIYFNEAKKLLILIENKDSINDHQSENANHPQKYAVDGVKHYLKFFTHPFLNKEHENIKNYFKHWKYIGIAVSGNIENEYSHKVSTFVIKKGSIENINNNDILNETEYLALFENINIEEVINQIYQSSNDINRILRHMDSQKRPILLSSLMICLFDGIKNDFRDNFMSYEPRTIIINIPLTIENILSNENIPKDKIDVLKNQFSYAIKDDKDIENTDVLKNILAELNNKVIPIFKTKTNYDIIGKFYEEFLKYAGVTNVKNGIVLTPRHVTELFTDLVEFKTNDVVFDPCCGTGAFLIAGMNKIIKEMEHSNQADKQALKEKIKENQLIGFEKNPTMFALSISNMLFRGDGKSQIYHVDFFDESVTDILEDIRVQKDIKPTIGFINPPYGGLDNSTNPTKKEIQFLVKLLDTCSKCVVMIAPLSTYFKEDNLRNKILSKHSLKCVINMPNELFQPTASTHTAISIFETNTPHNDKEVLLYNLEDDGFVLSKHKGRMDVLNKWSSVKNDLLKALKTPKKYVDDLHFVKTQIKDNDEWIIQAHSKTDYSTLKEDDFLLSLKRYIIFQTKKKLNHLRSDIDEITFYEILKEHNIDSEAFNKNIVSLDLEKFKEFKIEAIFTIEKGQRLVETKRVEGEIPLITASSYFNGITSSIDLLTFENRMTLNRNKITIDMFCNVFYHSYEYFSDDNIHTLSFKDPELEIYNQNTFIALFLITILKKLLPKYGFGRQVRLKRLLANTIVLPVTDDNCIDFQFMENYIKSLPYSKYV